MINIKYFKTIIVHKIKFLEKEVCKKNKNQKMFNIKKHHNHPAVAVVFILSIKMNIQIKILSKTSIKILTI